MRLVAKGCLKRFLEASDKAHKHARTCRKCFHPIVDEAGNPQYYSEACKDGWILLKEYEQAETMYFFDGDFR